MDRKSKVSVINLNNNGRALGGRQQQGGLVSSLFVL